jgi:hypothetical protein
LTLSPGIAPEIEEYLVTLRHPMTFRLLLTLALGVVLVAEAPADEVLYGRRIVGPENPSADLKAALADLERSLHTMTGQKFISTTDLDASGITLLRANHSAAPRSIRTALADKGREAFHLEPSGNERLWIVAHTDAGLCHGIYAYLEQLGCRWLIPSERWEIVPHRADIRLAQPRTAQPAFVSRTFFGTGGFGGALPCDPKLTMQGRWRDWQRRNRFGGIFILGGHSGEAFNAAHKKELEEHPEYRAMVNHQRVPFSAISKFCASNEEVLQLYIANRIAQLRLQRKLDPDGPRSYAVSVEPADGGGHCECPACQQLGSVSDRVFTVANRVARAVAAEFPDGRVSLYAYNEHAAVPRIKLEPNVYVTVVPYAFQRTGFSPDQLLEAWSRKVDRLSVYDYWSIPDWTHDLPTFDFLGAGPARLRWWHAHKVEGFSCESTFSGGAMGPGWYVAGRLAWDPTSDEQKIFAEFLELAFRRAQAPMGRMLRRWAEGFCLTSHELALSYRDVDEAWRLANGLPDIQGRVADYGRYVEYLRRRFEYVQATGEARHAAAVRLLEHGWNIYHSAMIHSFRLSQLVTRDEAARHPELRAGYDSRDKQAAGWQAIRPLEDSGVRALVSAGVRDFSPCGFTTRRFSGKLVPLTSVPQKEEFSAVLFPSSTQLIEVAAPAELKTLRLRVGCEKPVHVTMTDAHGGIIHDETVTTGEKWREQWSELSIALPGPGAYRVQLWSPKRIFRLSVPLGVPLSLPSFVNSQGTPTPRLYFYVPPGTERLALFASYIAAGPPRFFDPMGTEVKPQFIDGGKLMLLDVSAGQRGAVWSLDRAKAPNEPIRMLNAPQSYAFSAETLLVPEDATKPAE